jgi:spore coat protein A
MLNACNSRFLNPKLVATAGLGFPNNAEPAPNVAGPSFIQIGTEGGYMQGAVPVNGKKQLRLLVAPAERADVLVNFTGLAGQEFILYNDAPGPFPGGAKIFDYYPMNPKTPTSIPGFGPNTRTLLKIRVVAPTITVTMPTVNALNAALPALIDPPLVNQVPGVPTPVPVGVITRQLTLNEGFDEYGRLAQFLGTHVATNPGFFGRRYMDAATEVVPAGSVEVWEIANLTADAHPIHFHLVNVQVLSRQRFSVRTYSGIPNFLGGPVAPDANELGWKETVRMNPGEVTRVIMKFDLPVVPFTVPVSPRTGGNEYVWHCHILEHEEHDMMRPLVVV